MAAAHIAGRYALYKEGTARAVRWIKTAAGSCADVRRELQKETVTTKDLLTLANAIASSKPSIEVPALILELIDDVITGRQICAEWYDTQPAADEVVLDSNRTHRHFIEVLCQIYDLLRAARALWKQERTQGTPATKATAEKPRDDVQVKESLANLFEQLDLQEPPPEPLGDEPEIVASAPASKRKLHVPPADRSDDVSIDDGEEKRFALWCYLQDLHDVREMVVEAWKEFEAGQLSFLAASTISGTAFGIMRRADATMLSKYPEFGNYNKLLETLGLCIVRDNHNLPCIATIQTQIPLDSTALFSKMLCPTAAGLLQIVDVYWIRLPAKTAAEVSPEKDDNGGSNDDEAPEPDTALQNDDDDHDELVGSLFATCSYHPFATEILRLMGEITRMTDPPFEPGEETSDELCRGFQQMRRERRIQLWFLVACQTYMDVYGIMTANPEFALLQYRKAALDARASYTIYLEASTSHPYSQGSRLPSLRKEVPLACKVTRAICGAKRVSGQGVSPGVIIENMSSEEEWWPSGMYQKLPLTPGDALHQYKMTMHIIGLDVTNNAFVVLAMVHLYRAVQHYGLIDLPWKDMDWFAELHSKVQPLVTAVNPGADVRALLRHYEISMGMSPTATLSLQKMKQLSVRDVRARRRRINSGSKFIRAMGERAASDHKLGFSRGEVTDVVLRSMSEEAVQEVMVPEYGRQPTKNQTATGVQLLRTFKSILVADEPEINFDNFRFWARCVEIFDGIQGMVSARLPKTLRNEATQPMALVLSLLHDACTYREASRPIEQSTIGPAAEVLREYINSHGDELTTAAFQQSSGHIPEHLHPANLRSFSARDLEEDDDEPKDAADNGEETASPLGTGLEGGQGEAQSDTEALPTVQQVFAARKKRGRRLLRTRK